MSSRVYEARKALRESIEKAIDTAKEAGAHPTDMSIEGLLAVDQLDTRVKTQALVDAIGHAWKLGEPI